MVYDMKSCLRMILSVTKCENLNFGAYLVTIFSLILIGYRVLCGQTSMACGICYLVFIGSITVRFDLSDYKLPVIGQVKSDSFQRQRQSVLG